MPPTPSPEAQINLSYMNLRWLIGVLGIAMPLLLPMLNGFKVENSISHYYYTNSTIVFTGILITFGLFLFSYQGHQGKENEFLTDNLITNLAGIAIIIVALVPTACSYCADIPNGHNDGLKGKVHLISAGIFIFLMGYISLFHFTKSKDNSALKVFGRACYRAMGIMIWLSLLVIILMQYEVIPSFENFTFWLESLALWCFGIAWLVKGERLEWIVGLGKG